MAASDEWVCAPFPATTIRLLRIFDSQSCEERRSSGHLGGTQEASVDRETDAMILALVWLSLMGQKRINAVGMGRKAQTEK